MGTQYSVLFENQSTLDGRVCIFQQDPNINVPNVMSLAWFTEAVHPNTQANFTWTIDYSFVWAETGLLQTGVFFIASQVLPADLAQNNQVTLQYYGGAYAFGPVSAGPSGGNLYISEAGTVPAQQAAVGIGMSGNGTFAVQAEPNVNLVFTPHPTYWIAYGSYQPGEVLDIQSMTSVAELKFPPSVYSLTAVLGPDNKITVQSTLERNAAFVRARQRVPAR